MEKRWHAIDIGGEQSLFNGAPEYWVAWVKENRAANDVHELRSIANKYVPKAQEFRSRPAASRIEMLGDDKAYVAGLAERAWQDFLAGKLGPTRILRQDSSARTRRMNLITSLLN